MKLRQKVGALFVNGTVKGNLGDIVYGTKREDGVLWGNPFVWQVYGKEWGPPAFEEVELAVGDRVKILQNWAGWPHATTLVGLEGIIVKVSELDHGGSAEDEIFKVRLEDNKGLWWYKKEALEFLSVTGAGPATPVVAVKPAAPKKPRVCLNPMS